MGYLSIMVDDLPMGLYDQTLECLPCQKNMNQPLGI